MKTTQLWSRTNPLNLKGTTMLELPKKQNPQKKPNSYSKVKKRKCYIFSIWSEVRCHIWFLLKILGFLTKLSWAVLISRNETGINDSKSFWRASSWKYQWYPLSQRAYHHPKQLLISVTVTQRSSLLHPLCGRDASEKGSAVLAQDLSSSPPLNPLPSSPQAPKATNEGYKEETN